jgi:hypothetical protein
MLMMTINEFVTSEKKRPWTCGAVLCANSLVDFNNSTIFIAYNNLFKQIRNGFCAFDNSRDRIISTIKHRKEIKQMFEISGILNFNNRVQGRRRRRVEIKIQIIAEKIWNHGP